MDLAKKKCVPCEGGTLPLTSEEASILLSQLVTGWSIDLDVKTISKIFSFKTFLDAIRFVNEVARLAEKEGHHPDMIITYNKVTLHLTTHAIKGLSENDFILAAKIDAIS